MIDKSNNQVHIRWLPLLVDFGSCSGISWGSLLAWMYHSLYHVARRDTTDIAGCTLLLMSCIYHMLPQWCPEDRQILTFPLAVRLIGMSQQTRDHHAQRVLRSRTSLDQLALDEVRSPREWGTWLSVVPLECFNIVKFHQPNQVKCQFKVPAGCRVRHLSGEDVLDDPRLTTLPNDVQPMLSQPREVLQLPTDVPDRWRRAREVRSDMRRPA
ncbi:hypothetical protein Ahy_B10g105037 [Arachis hypogaea]|uniref:Aminotransferase-like plant mobile domain-containing protein n=1 Tax=Arachis hypogaea TaxID=3818 RepID=A0A444X711_ARAHY|nr:hypothetical protein Ahy_B10g105037 [Arachis hypogaea]